MTKRKLNTLKPKISNYPEEHDILDRNYWLEKASIGYNYEYFQRTNKIRPSIFEFAPESIKLDKEINIIALSKGKDGVEPFHRIHEALRNDKSFIIDWINSGKFYNYSSLSNTLQMDPDIYKLAFINHPYNYKYSHTSLSHNKELALELTSKNPKTLEYLPNFFSHDTDIALCGLQQNPRLIHYINKVTLNKILKEKKKETDNCIDVHEFVQANPDLFRLINGRLLNDLNFMKPYLEKTPNFIQYAGLKIRDNKEVMSSLATKGVMSCASDKLKNDKEFMLSMIKTSIYNFNALSKELKNDINFCLDVLDINYQCYDRFLDSVQNHNYIIRKLLTYPKTFKMLPYDKQKHLESESERKAQSIEQIIELDCLTEKLVHNLDNKSKIKRIKI